MDANIKAVIVECTEGSDAERLTFPQVVGKLMGVGVERYHADLQRGAKIYYMPDGESEAVRTPHTSATPVAHAFSGEGIQAALRAIQAGEIGYRTFCARIMQAGCVAYVVSLAGRCAIYLGRGNEFYVEPFPRAK
jgi:uncharacterized protein YbcV (DUF1398 family)